MHLSHIYTIGAACCAALCFTVSQADAAFTISKGTTTNVTCSGGVCTSTAKNAVLNVEELATLLGQSDVRLVTGGGATDIQIATPFDWTSESILTLDATQSVTFSAAVHVLGTGGLGILTNDGGTGGLLSFAANGSVSFANLLSSLVINQQTFALVDSVKSLAVAIASNPSGNIALAASYDASQDGTYASAPIPTTFAGAFEGLGNTISNLSINTSSGTNIGLFADIGTGGTVASILLSNASVSTTSTANLSVATLAAENDGTILNASVSGSVTGVGSGALPSDGGLVGNNTGTIAYSQSAVAVTGGDSCFVGGLVGASAGGTISTSSATGAVVGGQGSESGGFVGFNAGQISQSFATGTISTQMESKVGGFAGADTGPISDSYAIGNAAQAEVLGFSGGFVGFFQPTGTNILTRDYSTGAPTGGNFDGGFVGFDNSSGANLATNYWDTTTSGITKSSQGAGYPPSDPGITGLTSKQLRAHLPKGFSPKTWAEKLDINSGFPFLIANPPPSN